MKTFPDFVFVMKKYYKRNVRLLKEIPTMASSHEMAGAIGREFCECSHRSDELRVRKEIFRAFPYVEESHGILQQ